MVGILRDGAIYFGKGRIKPGDLPGQIRERGGRGAEKKAYTRADAHLRYHTVLEVLDAVHFPGVEKIAFLVDQRRTTSSGPYASAPVNSR